MKKKYVKTPERVLVSATAEQIADPKVEKFEVEVPDAAPPVGPMEELTGLIRDLAGDVKSVVDKQKEQLAAYEKAAQRGFILPGVKPPEDSPAFTAFMSQYEKNAKISGMSVKDAEAFFGDYDLAVQGKELQDKIRHPLHIIDEATRIEMAKFYCLLLRAGKDPRAMSKFIDVYGKAVDTPVGDTGNVFPLPKPIEAEILAFAREVSVLLQYCRVWPMTSDKMGVPSETGAVTVGWGNETSESEPEVTEVELSADELSAYSVVKNATLADSISDIVGWLNSALAEAAGLELDNQGFNGTGSLNGASFYGLLNATYGAYYPVVLASNLIAEMTADDLSLMISKLDGLKKQGARFFMHGQILHYIRTLKDQQDRPIFVETIGSAVPGSIWGFPYSEAIKMPSTQAANSPFILFGNLRYFALGRRVDTATLSVNPYLLWTTNRTAFKLYQRWAMKVGLRKGFARLLTGEEES
jgi:HK97 family phage major capsid protein